MINKKLENRKLSIKEVFRLMSDYNDGHNIKTKGTDSNNRLSAVVVFKPESFDAKFTKEARSYRFTNDNDAFISNEDGSIFMDSLDGSDTNVRLDWVLPMGYVVDYCYLESQKKTA